jgi:hypothetical protein
MPAATPTGEMRWERIAKIKGASIDGYEEEGWASAAGFEAGYIVVVRSQGYLQEGDSVHFSPDGLTWKRVRLPHGATGRVEARAAATDGQRVVVVGAYTPCEQYLEDGMYKGCRYRPMSWVSRDGHTWRASGAWSGPVALGQGLGSAFATIWEVPTGGWDAAQVFFSDDEDDRGEGPALWHSDDGVAWSRLRGRPADAGYPEGDGCRPFWSWAGFTAGADAGGRRVVVETYPCENGDALAISTDGRAYERLEAFGAIGSPAGQRRFIRRGLAPIDARPWVFVGETLLDKGDGTTASEATAWISADLTAWTTVALPVPSGMVQSGAGAIAYGEPGYVATGAGGSKTPDPYSEDGEEPGIALTWLSDDGLAWRLAVAGAARIWTLVDGPAGVLGFDPFSDPMSVWRLDSVP